MVWDEWYPVAITDCLKMIENWDKSEQACLRQVAKGKQKVGSKDVKPNFHWVTRIFDQILDYGPVYGFWTFVFERLNKVLKNYLTNNHAGGELETTFIWEFMRNTSLQHLVSIFPPTRLSSILIL